MSSYEEVNNARNLINALHTQLEKLAKKDSEQEIWPHAYAAIDEAIKLAGSHVQDHPVVGEIRELISPDTVVEPSTVRAADLLPLTALLREILQQRTHELYEMARSGRDWERRW
jgi:hypothetical protein